MRSTMADAVKLVTPRYAATLNREAPGPQLRNVSTRNWGADNYGALWERISMQMKRITTGEDMAVDTCLASSFGMFRKQLCSGLLTARSGQSVARLACGWARAPRPPPLTPELWWTGAATLKPCSRCSVFLGGPVDDARWRGWAWTRRPAAQLVPAAAAIVRAVDDTPKNKAGRPIEGWPARATGPARPARKIGPSGA
jgi:hypothetical protein